MNNAHSDSPISNDKHNTMNISINLNSKSNSSITEHTHPEEHEAPETEAKQHSIDSIDDMNHAQAIKVKVKAREELNHKINAVLSNIKLCACGVSSFPTTA